MKTQLGKPGTRESELLAVGNHAFPSAHAACRTILLISNDKLFHENLRSLANEIGLLVVRAERAAGTVHILHATRPDAVLLDLDLPNEAAWQIAELLLSEPGCPAVILLTGRTTQFDIQTAIRAGSLVSKNESAYRLLEKVEEVLGTPDANQAERNAIQRVLISWLRPSAWTESAAPAHRFWGINE